MTLETFIKYTRWTGLFRKTRTKESSYDIMEWYEMRWYHPLCWILFLTAYVVYLGYTAKSLMSDMLEEIEIHKDKKKDDEAV